MTNPLYERLKSSWYTIVTVGGDIDVLTLSSNSLVKRGSYTTINGLHSFKVSDLVFIGDISQKLTKIDINIIVILLL